MRNKIFKKLTYAMLMATIFSFSCKNQSEDNSTGGNETAESESSVITLEKKWETDSILMTPESVLFDENLGVYYVSCIGAVPPDAKDNDGYISKLDQQGQIIGDVKWVSGMHAPKGLGQIGNTLYVADIDELILIDVNTGQITNRMKIDGASFLNDVAVGNGKVYTSDTNSNTIYEIDGDKISILIQDTAIGSANGIHVEGDGFLFAGFNTGTISEWQRNGHLNPVADSIFGADGIEKVGENYFISSWNGEIYQLDKDMQKSLVLDTKSQEINAADIETVSSQNLLLIPTFFHNTVAAYEIK